MSEKISTRNHGKVHKREIPTTDAALPIEGSVELDMSVERLWQIFSDVPNWPRWNACFWWARVLGGELKVGTLLYWCFNPIRPLYLYKMPAIAHIVECAPQRLVTWEVTFPPGFHALHSYHFEGLEENRCRFGSWEVAEGPIYQVGRRFWLAHFRYVCRSSLAGAQTLAKGEV
jgi:hypothetical protein